MSRYPPPEYRGPLRDRSRSPPRFTDRRQSTASIFDSRPPVPPRAASDAPRGPRSQYDGARPPIPNGPGPGIGPRPAYSSLRDAPPLSSGERGRQFREREYDRRDRPPSRERSPPRNFKDLREYQPRDLDIGRARRGSRDGPPSAGSNLSEGQPLASAPFRGGYSRGRGRGDFQFRGGRGARSNLDERDLFRNREPSPQRWAGGSRDVSRDGREPERRDDRRFERRDDERRPSNWPDREREREGDRLRRDQPPPRLEARLSNESINSGSTAFQSSQALPINPARLALIESTGADPSVRRASIQQDIPPARDARRDQPETPAYLNGRAETTANRYGSRDSSPPTQAPPVPAFTLSFAPPTAAAASSSQSGPTVQTTKSPQEAKPSISPANGPLANAGRPAEELRPEPPTDAPISPRAPPPAPKAQLTSPPPAAPKAPRAHETEDVAPTNSRLHGVRSLEHLPGPGAAPPTGPSFSVRPSSTSLSPAVASAFPTLIQPVSPSQPHRSADLGAPTGPRAARMSPAQASVSPRPPFASPRSDFGGFQSTYGGPRMQTPPPSAPSGPRNRSYSVSPKAAPTAPKGNRGPPLAPRGLERGPVPPGRAPDRLVAPPSWAPPYAPRSLQWNQWRRPGVPSFADKTVPAKRDFSGEEKGKIGEQAPFAAAVGDHHNVTVKPEDGGRPMSGGSFTEMDVDRQAPKRQSSLISGHSAAQSFFGKPVEGEGEDEDMEDTGVSDTAQEVLSTSEEDESDLEDDNLALFHAKFERQKRQLEAQMVDLSSRPYRATTPLESIARLARISVRDLERIKEQRDQEMDVDDSPVMNNQNLLPLTTHSSESDEGPDLLTPKGEDNRQVAIRTNEEISEEIRRIRKPSPEPVLLPYLLKDGKAPYHESEAFREGLNRQKESEADVLEAMQEDLNALEDAERDVEATFISEYRRWRDECEELDSLKEEQERLEKQQSIEPGPEIDVPAAPPTNPFEGRRVHKFSSEYLLEQVLKQSEETARIEQERQDRETKKNQADMEKEARVPDQMTEEEITRGVFVDYNRHRDPDSLTTVFSYEPAPDTFTENEQQIFIAAFKETPKKWGEIASLLPGRTYEDCIRHYYANKWDGRFRDNRTKKLKAGGRRGRGGARGPRGRVGGLMADLARVEDFLSPESMSEKGRPRRAAAPTTFAEKEAEAKASLLGPSPSKKPGPAPKTEANGEAGPEKPGKRQKRTGEKPGRKAKNQPLAALAAAPQGTSGKTYISAMGGKDDPSRAQKLEEASLLANLQGGHHGILNPEGQLVYTQDRFMPSMGPPEEPERPKAGGQGPPPKQSASSYWSVPEQNDFIKYIGHFGRDFAAIAAHMGTKTQTMIKNHFQRQIDSGGRPELEQAANEADGRRTRGEDMGPPPTPTPIQKRKYDNPQPTTQRPLAPQSEGMEIDDTGPAPRTQAQAPKHASSPQYQTQPCFTTSAQNTPVPAVKVAPSPLPPTATPATSQLPASAHSRPLQHPLGSRLTFFADPRPESRSNAQPASGFRSTHESPPRNQPSQQSRTPAEDPQYLQNLVQEQERALRMQAVQGQYTQQDRMDQLQRQITQQRAPSQSSPVNQPLHNPPDRQTLHEERAPTPPRSTFPTTAFPRPSLGSSTFGHLGPPSFSSLGGGSAFHPSPPKRDDAFPNSVPSAPPARTPPTSAPPPSEPKRSNVLSLLNSEEEEPKPPKRESFQSAPQRTSSPAAQSYTHPTSAAPQSSGPGMRREPSFGQPSMPGQFQRGPFGQQSSNPGPAPPTLKHEPSSGGGSMPQPQKPDWAARVLGQSSQQSPATPTLERDVRPYYPHNHRSSLMGSLNQPRAGPSPPPLGGLSHSRTPSLTAQQNQQGREHSRSGIPGQQQTSAHQPAQPLQPSPYASQQSSSFSQQQPGQSQSQSHHSHNSSLSGPFPSLHHRTMSRDDAIRHEQALAAQREREENDMRWRQREAMEAERRREEERYIARRQQQEHERQQALHRAPPQPLQPPPFSGPPFGQNRSLDLRGQSRMETEMAMREEQGRQRLQDVDRRRQEAIMREREHADEMRRRQEEPLFNHRRTPLGGGYDVPPPPPPRR